MDTQNKPVKLEERTLLEQAIAALETRRSLLGDEIVDIAISSMREKLSEPERGARFSHEPQQRKLITVLFADVSGFTAMAETMDHEIVNSVINSLWSRVDAAIVDHSGRIDKHIGDAIMALYGTPTAHEDDPERAIRSALQIQSEIQDWKREQSAALPNYTSQIQNIQLRIGINTGPALLGTVGTIGEYTAIGDTVNLANRLETAAPKGGILISHDTHQHVRGVFDVTALEPINVKGKSEPIQVFTINKIKPRSFRDTTRGIEGLETRTIGREEELAQMQSAFKRVVEQQATSMINLVAEAGTGKSRLLFEFGKWLDAQESSVQIFKGRASQEISQIPFSLLRGILSSSFEIQESDRASVARKKLEKGIKGSLANKENAELYAHFIGHLIGLDYSESPYLKGILGDARQIHNLAFHYCTQVLAEVAQQHPVVIFLEDIHWADSGSLDFFEYLTSKITDLPILIIGLMRSTLFEQKPDWGTGTVQSLTINLLPLSEADTRRLIVEILQKVPSVPDELVNLIINKAEGSPFYVEELVKVLIEGGVIVTGQEQWSVKLERLSSIKVPATLTGILQARLDSLKPSVRETLQQASVVGRIFWTDIVDHMSNPEPQQDDEDGPISNRLGTLRTKELIYNYEESASREALEFIFKNAILHDVTYESVLLRLRPIYHAQAAEGLVQIGGERANEYAGRVGEHYERAEAWIKAAEWYTHAGEQAQKTYASDSAIHYYQKALDFINNHGKGEHLQLKLKVMQRLGEVMNWQARYPDAVNIYTAMLKEAEQGEDIAAQSRALQSLATSLSYQGDHQTCLDNAIRAETIARNANIKAELGGALRIQGSARFRLGDFQTALSQAEESLSVFTELDSQNEMARSLNLIAAAHYVSGRLGDAERNWEKALKIFQDLGNRQEGMDLLSNLGVVADGLGDYETAFKRYDNALTIARETGYKNGEIIFLTNRGSELVALENYEAAEADLTQAIKLAGITGSWCMPLTFNQRAEALIGLGRYEEAFYSARQALVLAEEDQTPEFTGMAWRTIGAICNKTNDNVHIKDRETGEVVEYDAETCFGKSASILVEAEIELEHAHTLREWARYKFQSGDQKEGQKMWQEARDIFASIGAQMEVERMSEMPK